MIATLLKAALVYEIAIQTKEGIERHHYWGISRQYCNLVGKPLLRVGMNRSFLEPPNGDMTIDIDPEIQSIPGGVWGDERHMPFTDKQFGVCFNEHTLEHLHTLEDVQLAVNECVRVADRAVFLGPSAYSLYSNLFCPTHNLRLRFDDTNNRIEVVKNEYRTGWGHKIGDTDHPPGLGQVMIREGVAPKVSGFSSGFLIGW